MKRLLMLFCLLAAPAFAAPGVMLKEEYLKATASQTAGNVGRVTKGMAVEVSARQGGWTQVRGNGRTGWVRILSVRSSAPASGAADLAGLVDAGATRRDPGKVVAVAGLRGLNEEELKLAHFNQAELLLLDRFMANRTEAEQFARGAGLARLELGYLVIPKAERRSGGSWGGDGQ